MSTAAIAVSRNGARPSPVAFEPPRDVVEHGRRRVLITLAIVTATLLEIVDVTIVNVALPNIQGNFGASVDQAAWIGTGYIIANVIVIPITPWLQMRFGRRQYYAASIAIFLVASVMCGLSNSLEALVFWRIIQGLGGGGLVSTSQAILRETFPANEQGKAAGVFTMGVIVGPTLGPTLGGIITDQLSWRWAFFVNVIPGIFALLVVLLLLRNPQKPRIAKLDYVGLGLLAVGIGCLQYVLDQGQEKDWFADQSIVLCSAIAAVGLVSFVVWELIAQNPVVNLSVLRNRSVAAGSILGMVLGISLYGSVLILPQYVQGSLGWTATLSGELLMFRALSIMVFTPLVVIAVTRRLIDPRYFIVSGFLLVGISNFMLANVTTLQADFWTFALPLAISGIGLAQLFVPLNLTVLGSVQGRDIPGAAAFFNLARQMGGSVAIAALVTVIAREGATHHNELGADIALRSGPVSRYVSADGTHAASDLNRVVTQQAQILAYADTARVVGTISLALAPLAFILRRPKAAPSAAAE
jgi:DHA2 family multidrug resistance protein